MPPNVDLGGGITTYHSPQATAEPFRALPGIWIPRLGRFNGTCISSFSFRLRQDFYNPTFFRSSMNRGSF
jgi:hypothetical protein